MENISNFELKRGLTFIGMKNDISAGILKPSICPKDKCRIEELLRLSLSFATQLLQAEDEKDLWAALLVAATAAEGLRFNRAFVFRKEETEDVFKGVTGIGPMSPEEASQVWGALEKEKPSFEEMVARVKNEIESGDTPAIAFIKKQRFSPPPQTSVWYDIFDGQKNIILLTPETSTETAAFLEKLGVEQAVAAPLRMPPLVYGFILVDNAITRKPFCSEELQFLETISLLVSVALERLFSYKELMRQKHLLLEAERIAVIGQLSSKVFHEIRNPLSALGGLSKVLLRRNVPEGMEGYLKTMVREAERLERVLEDIFQFSKPFELKKEPVRLFRLLQAALNVFLPKFKERGIHVSFECTNGDPIIHVDPKEMQLVFIHLMKSALEIMPAGGMLNIGVFKDDKGLCIKVIYSRKKADSLTTQTEATGLGLSLSKKIVELHGGSLKILSLHPLETEISICFPNRLLINGGKK